MLRIAPAFARRSLKLLALVNLTVWAAMSLDWLLGMRRLPVLADLPEKATGFAYPSVSVVVPARDEEGGVRAGVESVLEQEYPGRLSVIAVDDRSRDRTGEILEDLARKHPALEVLRVEELPPGWLGKTHAMQAGYLRAREGDGEWLLFTDADVVHSPKCLRRAVGYALAENLDHLTLFPEFVSRGVLLRGFLAAFALVFLVVFKPWKAGDPEAGEHMGIGAFNLVRRVAYEKAGTHRAIALRPDDDMKLAKSIKVAGMRTGVAFGGGLLAVEWHGSLARALRGVTKSVLPGSDYRSGLLVFGALALLSTNVLPFLTLFSRSRPVRLLSAANVLLVAGVYHYQARHTKAGPAARYALLHPVSMSLWVFAMLRSVYKVYADGGVEWRGTFYPLDDLRKNDV